jgi:hypothetical protein
MCSLQDPTRSDSDSEIDFSDFDSSKTLGWESELVNYLQIKKADKRFISLANEKVPLNSIIHNFGIIFTEKYSPSGWTLQANCPFKDHQDSTPSFGFNPKSGWFNCFGCNRKGRSVSFLSFIKGISPVEAAHWLLKNKSSYEDVITELEENNKSIINDLLLSFSIYVNDFLKKNKNNADAFLHAEKVTESLDIYLLKNMIEKDIDIDNFSIRLEKTKKYLDNYDSNINSR